MRNNWSYILLAGFMVQAGFALAQSTDRCYVSECTFTGESQCVESVQYFDGLGRPSQKVSVGLSPTEGVSIVERSTLDAFGRVSRVYKSLPVQGSGNDFLTLTDNSYTSYFHELAYTSFGYADNPLRRQISETGPGGAWLMQGKGRTSIHLTNEDTGVLACICYKYDGKSLKHCGTYDSRELLVTKNTDEDGHTNYAFTDKTGRLLLSRQVLADEFVETYYVYDEYGRLKAVLPPSAAMAMQQEGKTWGADSEEVEKYAYCYEYDTRNRCVSKKFPGTAPITMQYNDADQVIFRQTGEQRAKGAATRNGYDALGRLICQTTSSRSRSTVYHTYAFLKAFAIGKGLEYEERLGYGTASDMHGTLPTGYIDNGISANGDTLSCLAAIYYDKHGRIVQKAVTNILGRYDKYFYQYTYTGKIARMLHEHHSSANDSVITEEYEYAYDRADRLLHVTHCLNYGEKVTLLTNTYDDICRLIQRSAFGKEEVAYTYNIRDWITGIHSANFSEVLAYNTGSTPLYGGNISAMSWTSGEDGVSRKYTFSYDGFSRLASAVYTDDKGGNGHYNTTYTYDITGNPLSISRNGLTDDGTYGCIDNVSLSYNGNQLVKADDGVEDPTYKDTWNFVDGSTAAVEYEYDRNGNLKKDLNKGITSIRYYDENLPAEIVFSSGNTIRYRFDALGNKQQAVYTTALPATTKTIDYCGNMIYEDGVLAQVLIDGGYITLTDGLPVYHYYLQDHLGNNRVVANRATGMVEQTNHYYPYGGLMAESTYQSKQRYKYNGKELERMHGLDWYDYGARWYDAAVCVWTAQDPLAEKYYGSSPYTYCTDRPMDAIDPSGKYIIYIAGTSDHTPYLYKSGGFYRYYEDAGILKTYGNPVQIEGTIMQNVFDALNQLYNLKNPYIRKVFDTVSNSRKKHYLTPTTGTSYTHAENSNTTYTYLNLEYDKTGEDFKRCGLNYIELIGHELKHAYDMEFHKQSKRGRENQFLKINQTTVGLDEFRTVRFENLIRKEEGRQLRSTYGISIYDERIPAEYNNLGIWN